MRLNDRADADLAATLGFDTGAGAESTVEIGSAGVALHGTLFSLELGEIVLRERQEFWISKVLIYDSSICWGHSSCDPRMITQVDRVAIEWCRGEIIVKCCHLVEFQALLVVFDIGLYTFAQDVASLAPSLSRH